MGLLGEESSRKNGGRKLACKLTVASMTGMERSSAMIQTRMMALRQLLNVHKDLERIGNTITINLKREDRESVCRANRIGSI